VAREFDHMRKPGVTPKSAPAGSGIKANESFHGAVGTVQTDRLFLVSTKSPIAAYKGAHFATFPPKLIEPCILAGCPKEVCKKCGEPRVRIVNQPKPPPEAFTNAQEQIPDSIRDDGMTRTSPTKDGKGSGGKLQKWINEHPSTTTGWTDCGCGAGFEPGVVHDPFSGSATVAMVAYQNNRNYVGTELSTEYIELGNKRIKGETDKYTLIEGV